MPSPPRFRSALLGLPLLVLACAATPRDERPNAPPPETEAPLVAQTVPEQPLATDSARAQYHILAGEMAAGRDQPEQAAREFLAALAYIDDVELAQRATALAIVARNEDLSLQAARRWLALDPTSADAREVIASLSLKRGELAETLTQCRELIQGHPGGPAEGFMLVLPVLSQAGADRADGALSVMRQLVEEWPDLAAAHLALGLTALHYGRLELAEAAARKAQALDPQERKYVLLLISIWVRANRIAEADARIDQLARTDTPAADLRIGYAQLLLEFGHRDAARRQLESVLKLDPRNADARYALGTLAFEDGDLVTAQKNFEGLLDGPRSSDAALQLGRIAETQQRYAQALAYYRRITQGQASVEAAVRSAYVLARMKRLAEARALLQELRERLPQMAIRFHLAEGELLIDAGQSQAAVELYNAALDEDADNPDLLYGRSLAYERLGQIDAAERDLRRILADEPDDARALNALGYMLVVHAPERIAEAETLITRALALEPDDAAIIDSMGWLQFKLGRPEQALEWLQKAYAKFPDPEVAAHLGEVLWVLNRREEAQNVWTSALRKNPDHPVLRETMQRLSP
ncbi:Flp pilus assembly protein TadD, contains TPR repeats [Fontimonas thermophila]|uniref:Flp pilus assembly protein TadD, contains TPR repeats n=1 Tax=Fontimonas thermophila TaxID=1076937 RepID=A0A1I2INE1_9GAMM|nr:tetratricopeptide repeat protein [Fontimonas thermophila]SFF43153.1 Flp pilus assembly protein TadD, contains TPR repeats [Fontimonas thermophila]